MWIIQISSLLADLTQIGLDTFRKLVVFTETAELRSSFRVPILLPFINHNLMFELIYMPVYVFKSGPNKDRLKNSWWNGINYRLNFMSFLSHDAFSDILLWF